MKISYQKNWDKDGFVITQTIKAETEKEKEIMKKCLTEYSIRQNSFSVFESKEVYSA